MSCCPESFYGFGLQFLEARSKRDGRNADAGGQLSLFTDLLFDFPGHWQRQGQAVVQELRFQ